ncbi:MAG: DUF3006 domain-containing protein [Eggerthellaceae bacterium]|nr:DUF3006 domain-containing protein [Eggerthellaceae bacterium]
MIIVDRIEGAFAVCEMDDKSMQNIALSELPAGIKEGDVLAVDNGTYVIDAKQTKERSERIAQKMNRLFK